MPHGTRIQGLAGLRDYLRQNQAQINHQFSRKLLGHALGRQILLSDKRLLADMQSALQQMGSRFSAAVLTSSPAASSAIAATGLS